LRFFALFFLSACVAPDSAAVDCGQSPSDGASEAQPPNIVLFLTDDLGYGDLGCTGSLQIPTPRIDSLAAEGVQFTQAYMSAAVCAPARAGLMTGRYQQRFGFEFNLVVPISGAKEDQGLPTSETTVAKYLQRAGYRTAIFGKWHLGQTIPAFHPLERGFDEFFGHLEGSSTYWPRGETSRLLRGREKITEPEVPYLTDALAEEACAFIRRQSKAPFFCFVSFNAPHTPLQAKPELLEQFAHLKPGGRRKYAAMVASVDEAVGRVLDTLEEMGHAENTLVLFLNDNGGAVGFNHSLNPPLNGMKGTFLEGGVRVPMLARWPGVWDAGSQYDEPVSSLDVLPTFLAAAEVSVPSGLDGVDLAPYLASAREGRPHETLFWKLDTHAAIRHGDWKLVRLPDREPFLFDLANDEGESLDLAAEEPALVRDLLQRLATWENELAPPLWRGSPAWRESKRKLYDATYERRQLP
jgi:arylsulfatase A-like enzyme